MSNNFFQFCFIFPFFYSEYLSMKNTKNLYGPKLSLIFVVPILLFSVLIKTNLISKNFFPNLTGAIIFAIFMIYGFLSIKLSKKRFTPTEIDGVTPEYIANGFEFWTISVFLTTLLVMYFMLQRYFQRILYHL